MIPQEVSVALRIVWGTPVLSIVNIDIISTIVELFHA